MKLKVFKNGDNKDFPSVQKLTMAGADFNEFMRLRNQQVIAAENVDREENLYPVLIPTLSLDADEQLEVAHKLVDLLDRTNRKIFVTMLRYSVKKPESFHAQLLSFARKNEDSKFQQTVYVNYEIENNIVLPGVMISVFDKKFTNQPICKVL